MFKINLRSENTERDYKQFKNLNVSIHKDVIKKLKIIALKRNITLTQLLNQELCDFVEHNQDGNISP